MDSYVEIEAFPEILTPEVLETLGRDTEVLEDIERECRHALATEMIIWREEKRFGNKNEDVSARFTQAVIERAAQRFSRIPAFEGMPEGLEAEVGRSLFIQLAAPRLNEFTDDLLSKNNRVLKTERDAIEVAEAATMIENDPAMMRHIREHSRAALIDELRAWNKKTGGKLDVITSKAIYFSARSQGAVMFGKACEEDGIPFEMDAALASNVYRLLSQHRFHLFTKDLWQADDAELAKERLRIRQWETLEGYETDDELLDDIQHHLRFHAARAVLEWRLTHAVPEIPPAEAAGIVEDAVNAAIDSFDENHNLALPGTAPDARPAQSQYIFLDLAERHSFSLVKDLFIQTPIQLATEFARNGFYVLNDIEQGAVTPDALQAETEKAGAVILSARTYGFDIPRLYVTAADATKLRLT